MVPFTTFVDDFGQTWRAVAPEENDEDELARHFVGQLYDVFVEHRGLVVTLLASEAWSEEEMAEVGIADIRKSLALLGEISSEGMDIRGMKSSQPDLAAYSTVANGCRHRCVACDLLRNQSAVERAIVEELTQSILHGFLHPGHLTAAGRATAQR